MPCSFQPVTCQRKESLLSWVTGISILGVQSGFAGVLPALPHIRAQWRPPCGHLAGQMPLDAAPNTEAWAGVTWGGSVCLTQLLPGRWRLGQLPEGFFGSPPTRGDSRQRRGAGGQQGSDMATSPILFAPTRAWEREGGAREPDPKHLMHKGKRGLGRWGHLGFLSPQNPGGPRPSHATEPQVGKCVGLFLSLCCSCLGRGGRGQRGCFQWDDSGRGSRCDQLWTPPLSGRWLWPLTCSQRDHVRDRGERG